MSRQFKIQNSKLKIQLNERGSILAVFVIMLTVLSAFLLAAASLSLENRMSIARTYQQDIALNIAEAGVNRALWELRGADPSYTGETNNTSIDGGAFDVAVTSIDANSDYIVATAYVPSKANAKYKKAIKVKITDTPTTTNPAFSYAIQAGAGGINVGGSSDVRGNLYSNGPINVSGASATVSDPGNAWAVTTISDPKGGIKGTKHPGAVPVQLPTIDLNQWKSLASAGGTISGDYSPPATGSYTNLGPKEITGSMSVGSNQKVNLTGPLYIHGNLTVSGGGWKLDDSFGSYGTIVLVDGQINITGGDFYGNSSGSYILFISNNGGNSQGSGSAIYYRGNASGENLALYAYQGAMTLEGSGEITAMTGQTLFLNGGGEIDYKSGLASTQFAGGPGGTWAVKEWQEISP